MSKKDYYKILGVSKNSTLDEIKEAFRKKAMKYHPDRNKSPNAEEKFKEINEAYQVLSDPDKKAKYDRFGHNAFENVHFETNFDFDDIFGDIFSSFFGGGGRRRNYPQRGSDIYGQIAISFLDSYFGKKIVQKLEKIEKGKRVKKDIEITIPAGIRDGMNIRVAGYGEEGYNGGPNGDLIIRVFVKAHPHFKRIEDDIHLNVPVSIFDIINESIIYIPTPEKKIKIKLKSHYFSDDAITLQGKGFKSPTGYNVGNFIIHLRVYLPKLSLKEKKAILKTCKNAIEKDKIHKKWLQEFK